MGPRRDEQAAGKETGNQAGTLASVAKAQSKKGRGKDDRACLISNARTRRVCSWPVSKSAVTSWCPESRTDSPTPWTRVGRRLIRGEFYQSGLVNPEFELSAFGLNNPLPRRLEAYLPRTATVPKRPRNSTSGNWHRVCVDRCSVIREAGDPNRLPESQREVGR